MSQWRCLLVVFLGVSYLPLTHADELLKAGFERNQEIEADLISVKYLRKAGNTKEDYLAHLNWIKTEVNGGGGCRVLCDHPHIDDRIKAVKEGENVLKAHARTQS
jgi:predicted Zn-dependent protease